MKNKRYEYVMKIKDIVLKKMSENEDKNMLEFVLNELEGDEKIYGLQLYFTTDTENNLEEESKDLIFQSHMLVLGDMMGQERTFVNYITQNVLDSFYIFDKLNDGYLITHQFDEMEKFINERKK